MRGDGEGMRQQAATPDQSLHRNLISHLEAFAWPAPPNCRTRDGHLRSRSPSRSRPATERAALFEAATAVWEALYGNPAAARQKAAAALALGRGHEVDYAAAFALALVR